MRKHKLIDCCKEINVLDKKTLFDYATLFIKDFVGGNLDDIGLYRTDFSYNCYHVIYYAKTHDTFYSAIINIDNFKNFIIKQRFKQNDRDNNIKRSTGK